VLAALTFAALVPCARPDGCTCLPPPEPRTPAEARAYVAGAAAVFVGTVVRVEQPRLRALAERGPAADVVTVVLQVRARWRGPAGDRAVVVTASRATMCAVDFVVGQSYFVVAGERGAPTGPAGVWPCGHTRPAAAARTIRKLLGRPLPAHTAAERGVAADMAARAPS
jgi:hypothetical protein